MSRVRVPCLQLPIGAGAFAQESARRARSRAGIPSSSISLVDELEELVHETARLHFRFAPEIDQLAVQPVARRAPAVLIDHAAAIDAEAQVLLLQFVQPHDDGLDDRRHRDRVVDARLRIADSHFERVEERMEPDVPPDLLRVIDAVGADEELQVILVFGEAFEGIGNAGARETLEHFQAVTFEARCCGRPRTASWSTARRYAGGNSAPGS